ncbi:MAG: SsrA-binding protein SmpB [Proteobacteria bacterium]|nr:SsrA-binding protein SmpB [Pseudomonadota bacterium]
MVKVVASHRKARFYYDILETFEAGIVLSGAEIKSVRAGKVSLAEGWVSVSGGVATLKQVFIHAYTNARLAASVEQEQTRPRQLLLSKRELGKLEQSVQEKGLAVIPLSVYIKGRWAKVKIGLARGKKLHDKRHAEKKRTAEREIQAALKTRR